MVHTRTAEGQWKHSQRSWLRGFARRPGVPPPSPPVFHGVELVFAESVVQAKDISLPTIISLAEHSGYYM